VTRESHRATLHPGASPRRGEGARVCLALRARATAARPEQAFVRYAPLVRAEATSGSAQVCWKQVASCAQLCWPAHGPRWLPQLGQHGASGRSRRSGLATARQNPPSGSRILHRFQGSHVGGWEALQLFALGRFNEVDAGFIPRASTIVNDPSLRRASWRNLSGAMAIARTGQRSAAGQRGVRVSASPLLSDTLDSLRSRCELRL
jgi:hypothetical protein